MTRLAFRTIVFIVLATSLVGCGALQFSLPSGSSFAQAPGPPLPPGSGDFGGSYALPAFPQGPSDFFFFPGIFTGGSNPGSPGNPGGGAGGGTGGDTTPPPSNPTPPSSTPN